MNELNFSSHFENLVSTTLNKPIADVKALLVSENNEIKPDASDILKSLFVAHIENVRANTDFTQSPKFKERVENLRVEYLNKSKKEAEKFKAEIDAFKGAKTDEELRFVEQIAQAKMEGDAKEAKARLELEGFKRDIAAKERNFKLDAEIRKNIVSQMGKFALNPESIDDSVSLIRLKHVSDFVEKDGVIYPLGLDGKVLVHPTGHNVTLQEVALMQLSKLGTLLNQPPTGGAGNVGGASDPFKGW
jgi:hypothetical protein